MLYNRGGSHDPRIERSGSSTTVTSVIFFSTPIFKGGDYVRSCRSTAEALWFLEICRRLLYDFYHLRSLANLDIRS